MESLAASIPVIISDLTPWQDLEHARAGYDLPLKEESRWVQVIEHCIALSSEGYDDMAYGARNYAHNYLENHEDPEKSFELFQ